MQTDSIARNIVSRLSKSGSQLGRALLATLLLVLAGCGRTTPGPAASATSAAPSALAQQQTAHAASEQGSKSIASTESSAGEANAPGPNESAKRQTAILAGGCFWGMEELLRKIPGVLETDVGYAGGVTANPNYEQVHEGTTGHAEAVRVVFDPTRLSYESLLENWYFRMHDPTTENRQGNDVGSQYRSAIFFTSPEQQNTALRVKERVDQSGKWSKPVVTEVVAAGPFTLAEDYHQDYLQANPDGYTCHFLRE
jgi:methionine-S-sulfoxide reductase